MPSFLLKELYMRIDKYISGCGYASRKDVKKLIKQGLVFIDGEVCKKPEEQTDENSIVEVDGERLIYREFVYLMLNKPQGCVSAVYDKKYPVVTEFVPEEYAHFEVYPVGRLDIDTEGLLILTNDGQFAHEMTSPKQKTYFVSRLYEEILMYIQAPPLTKYEVRALQGRRAEGISSTSNSSYI